MLTTYIRFALKDIKKSRLIFVGSMISLIVGTLCFYAIQVWVKNEQSMDRFHHRAEDIYVVTSQRNPLSGPRASTLTDLIDQQAYPAIDKRLVTRTYEPNEGKLIVGERTFSGKGVVVDSTFFDVFNFNAISGNTDVLLRNKSDIVLSESFAKRLFGTSDPIGQSIRLEMDNVGEYIVQGVLDEIPSNSSFSFDFLVPSHSKSFWSRMAVEFLLMHDGTDHKLFNEKIENIARKRRGYEESVTSTFPFVDIYFEHPFEHFFFDKTGDASSVSTMKVIGWVVLLISVLNFTNVQATHMLSQFKTQGIKRVNGATIWDIYGEALTSRIFYGLTAAAVGLLTFYAILPSYEQFLAIKIEKDLAVDFLSFFTIALLSTLLSFGLFLIQNKNLQAGQLIGQRQNHESGMAKKILTTVQYTCAISLAIASVVIYQQFNYMVTKDLGYDYKNVISVKLIDEVPMFEDREERRERFFEVRDNYKMVSNESLNNPNFVSVTQSKLPIGSSAYPMSWKLIGGAEDYRNQNLMTVDPAYQSLLGLEMIEGRFFSEELDKDRQRKLVINEAAVKYYGIKDITTAKIANGSWGREADPYQIIGVVKDFHYQHLSKKVEPLMMAFMRDRENNFVYKINEKNFKAGLASVEEIFRKVNPSKEFDYVLLEELIREQYEKEKQLSQIFMMFMLIGLILSTIGLFTFALYETRRRIREIGIRKVLGASFESIMSLLSVSFLKWVVLAFVLACPITWYLLTIWLDNFANRIDLKWTVFLISGMVTLIMAMLTIFWQTSKSAYKNPVEALRYE